MNAAGKLSIVLAIAASVAVSGACAPSVAFRNPGPASSTWEQAFLHVSNEHSSPAHVYLVQDGARIRLGTVPGRHAHSFDLEGIAWVHPEVSPSRSVRFMLEPLGSSFTRTTPLIHVQSSQQLLVRLKRDLRLSSVRAN